MPESDKARKSWRVGEAILKLIDQSGLDAVTHARVARAAKVSRPWLYKYVGNKRTDLIRFAVDIFGNMITGIERIPAGPDVASFRKTLAAANVNLMNDAAKFPWVISLYFRFGGSQNLMGERIRDIEGSFLKRLSGRIHEVFGYPPEECARISRALTSMRMSLALRYIQTPAGQKLTPDLIQESVARIGVFL